MKVLGLRRLCQHYRGNELGLLQNATPYSASIKIQIEKNSTNFSRKIYCRFMEKKEREVSAAVKGVFECKHDNENFNKNITYFICKMIWLHVCSLSITLTSNYWCG